MRHRPVRAILLFGCAAAVAGCASSQNQVPSTRQQAASGDIAPAFLQWSGKFKSTEQQTSVTTMHARNAVFGTVRLTADGKNTTRAEIVFSIDVQPTVNGAYQWSLSSGDCHSNSIPVLPVNEFPLLNMASNRGQLDGVFNAPLPTSGRYHVNVFWSGGSDEGDVMACAPLQLGRRSRRG
jgi:hypothetical protein